ncbi:MAG: hypothetical protein EHM93_02060 [Bacteroidales bacterium]|nr:MAG: hypothetical protein EHM93_02060 [Bacteroidales bacterium]
MHKSFIVSISRIVRIIGNRIKVEGTEIPNWECI